MSEKSDRKRAVKERHQAWESAMRVAYPNRDPVKSGAFLPNVDPMVGEIAMAALDANAGAHPAVVATALALTAPDETLATELVSAVFELMLCDRKGGTVWAEEKAGSFLVGHRRVPGRDAAMMFGTAQWPYRALLAGPPVAVTVRMPDGPRIAWLAGDMQGVIVRQSEAIALGNAAVERLGGRIIEDRSGPEVAQSWMVEERMTDRAKRRAAALNKVDEYTVEVKETAKRDHARVALIEALDGCLEAGTLIHPEDDKTRLYVVERRVNESWVLAVAEGPGPTYDVPAGMAWVREDGANVAGTDLVHVGFNEDAATAQVAVPDPLRAIRFAAAMAPILDEEKPAAEGTPTE